jgi:hypothetical protein
MVNRIDSGSPLYYAKTSTDIDPLHRCLLVQSISRLMLGSFSTSAYRYPETRHILLEFYISTCDAANYKN